MYFYSYPTLPLCVFGSSNLELLQTLGIFFCWIDMLCLYSSIFFFLFHFDAKASLGSHIIFSWAFLPITGESSSSFRHIWTNKNTIMRSLWACMLRANGIDGYYGVSLWESNYNTMAQNTNNDGSTDIGIFQINSLIQWNITFSACLELKGAGLLLPFNGEATTYYSQIIEWLLKHYVLHWGSKCLCQYSIGPLVLKPLLVCALFFFFNLQLCPDYV